MDDQHLIKTVVGNCYENDVLNDVDYEYIRSSLIQKNVLTSMQLSTLDALKTNIGQRDHLFLEISPLLGITRFQKLIDVIRKVYPHVHTKVTEIIQTCIGKAQTPSKNQNESVSDKHSPGNSLPHPNKQPVEMGISELQSNLPFPDCHLTGNECEEDVQKLLKSGQIKLKAPLQVNFQPSTDVSRFAPCQENTAGDQYQMNTSPRGLAFIINNKSFSDFKEREGSDVDKDHLVQMFHHIGWHVTSKSNLTAQEMYEYLQKFARSKRLKSVSALSVVILTHGMDNDIYFGKDGELNNDKSPLVGTFINRFQLMQIFNSKNCPVMSGKPKWFIIQACRGNEEDICTVKDPPNVDLKFESDYPSTATNQQQADRRSIPDNADMCCFFSSSLGYKAYRMKKSGSPFISNLTKMVQTLSHMEVSKITQKIMANFCDEKLPEGKLTLPEFSTQLTKNWFLNPPKP